MKIESDKDVIEQAIIKTSRLAGKHLTLPVLSCVYLEASKKDGLIIKSTNLDLGIEIKIKVKVINEGYVAVPANIFSGVISSIKDKSLTIEVVEGNLKISTDSNSTLIKSMPADDFPVIPKIETGNEIILNTKDIVNGFKSVWYSASNSSIKPELGSVYIHHFNNGLVFAATDSFRLSEKKIQTKPTNDFPNTLIPFKNVSEIMKIFDDVSSDVKIRFEKNQASFVVDNIYIVSRLIDGSFPDYMQIIPKNYVSIATILKSDLINAIKTSNIFSDTLNQVKFKINVSKKRLDIFSKNNDIGEYFESIKASISGEDIELNFNSKYIIDCMQSILSESIVLSFGGVGRPLVITGVSDKSFMYLVMPMNK